jgi:hypothetical protein
MKKQINRKNLKVVLPTFNDVGGNKRSLLLKLTKEKVVEGILDLMPESGWKMVWETFGPQSDAKMKLGRNVRLWAIRAKNTEQALEQKKRELLKLTKAEVVKISYWLSDRILNDRYNSRSKTVSFERATLSKEREISITKADAVRMARRKSKMPVVVAKKKRKKKIEVQGPGVWIARMRAVNALMNTAAAS